MSSELEIASIFHGIDKLENLVKKVVNEVIPNSTDSQLEEIITYAGEMERSSFVIRGAATDEIQSRVERRLAGGRGRKDTMKTGISAEVARIASTLGISYWTLLEDARIFRVFGKELLSDMEPLQRSFYSSAIKIGGEKAHEAIELAQAKRADPTYSTRAFESDCRALMAGGNTSELEDAHWVNVRLNGTEHEYVKKKAKEWKCAHSEVLVYFLKNGIKRDG